MFAKKLWNLFAFLVCLSLIILMFFAAFKTTEDIILYKLHGKITTATIDNIYKREELNKYGKSVDRYFVDYSFIADDGNIYKISGYNINSRSRSHLKEMDTNWWDKKVGDKFEITYIKGNPAHNIPSFNLKYFGIFISWILSAAALLFTGLFIRGISLNSYFVFIYVLSTFVFLDILMLYYVVIGIVYLPAALLIIMLFFQKKYISSILSLCNSKQYTTATIENYEIEKRKTATIYRRFSTIPIYKYVPIQKIPFTRPYINKIGFSFNRLYVYEYADESGAMHLGQRFINILFGGKYNIGDKIKIVYNAKNPDQHYCLGKV